MRPPASSRAAGFFVVRSPLLSRSSLRAREDEPLGTRVHRVVTAARETPLREALDIASPSLCEALAEAPSPAAPPNARAFALMRYVERMRGRATPFGLCAGYSVGRLAPETTPIVLARAGLGRVITRLDVDLVATVASELAAAGTEPPAHLATRALVRLPRTLRLARRGPDGIVTYEDIARSPALDAVLESAREPRSWRELTELLLPFEEDRASRDAFLRQLTAHGLLVPITSPALTTEHELSDLGGHPLGLFGGKLRDRAIEEETAADRGALAAQIATFRSSASDRGVIHDLVKPLVEGALGVDVVTAALALTRLLTDAVPPQRDTRFDELRTFLNTRYEGRSAPLVEALDPDRGFSFPRKASFARVEDGPRMRALHRLYARALREGATEIVLEPDDLPAGPGELPRDAFALAFSLASTPLGPELWEPVLISAPATLSFARATAFDDDLRVATRAYLAAQAEAFPGSDVADVAYFIPGKSASYLQLPALQPFEITLAARCGAPASREIDVHDLLIGVAGREIVLTSRRTGRRIRPRVVSALVADRAAATSLARFLFALSSDGVQQGGFGWGSLEQAPFLPRLRAGKHVLSRARWNLSAAETRPLLATNDHEQAFGRLQALREARGLPRHALYRQAGDLCLPIDLDDRLSVAAWLDIAEPEMCLIEAPMLAESIVQGPEGPFHHEIILPFLPGAALEAGLTPLGQRAPAPADASERRAPGGDVLFLKLYGDRHALLPVLTDELRPLLEAARVEGLADRWFFLPYVDPAPHLRLRFFGPPAGLWAELLPRLHAVFEPLLASGVLERVVLDTYEPEVHRYGGAATQPLIESLFWASSEAALLFHDDEPTRTDDVPALLAGAVRSFLTLFAAGGLPFEDQAALALLAADRYRRSPDAAALRRRAGEYFRLVRHTLDAAAASSPPWPDAIGEALATNIQALRQTTDLTRPFTDILVDVLHVHATRLLTVWPETHDLEALVYHVLERHLRSRLARSAPRSVRQAG